MGGYWKPYQQLIDSFFEWLFADKRKRKMLKYLPESTYFIFEADRLINVTYEFADVEKEEEQRMFILFEYQGENMTLIL